MQNRLLAALPAKQFMRLAPHLERVPLPLGSVIYESGGEQGHVYFPASGIVSLLYVMNNGGAWRLSAALIKAESDRLLSPEALAA